MKLIQVSLTFLKFETWQWVFRDISPTCLLNVFFLLISNPTTCYLSLSIPFWSEWIKCVAEFKLFSPQKPHSLNLNGVFIVVLCVSVLTLYFCACSHTVFHFIYQRRDHIYTNLILITYNSNDKILLANLTSQMPLANNYQLCFPADELRRYERFTDFYKDCPYWKGFAELSVAVKSIFDIDLHKLRLAMCWCLYDNM